MTQRAREDVARSAAYEAWKEGQPKRRELSPEEQIHQEERQAKQAEHSAKLRVERDRLDELQLDSEELHAKLGKPGLGRLLHPFRNLKITWTLLNRQYAKEYNPLAAQSRDRLHETPLDQKRRLRGLRRVEEDRLRIPDKLTGEEWRRLEQVRRYREAEEERLKAA